MAQWESAVITTAGTTLMSQLLSESAGIEFVSLKIGDGTYTSEEKTESSLKQRTSLKSLKNSYGISTISQTSAVATIKAAMNNQTVEEGYYIKELGIFARKDGTEDTPILFCIVLANEADYFPDNESPAVIVQSLSISLNTVGGSVSITQNMSAYALADDLLTKMNNTNPTGTGSFSLNRKANTTVGDNSFAEGCDNVTSGECSHAEGNLTIASGGCSHAEGASNTSSGIYSHAEGCNNTSSGICSHAEGGNTIASSTYSHAEGGDTTASGTYSHAEGGFTTACGESSHSEGYKTIASGECSHVSGQYNVEDLNDTYAEIVGGGTSITRKNIRTLDWNGNAVYAGDVSYTNDNEEVVSLTASMKYSTNETKTGEIWLDNKPIYRRVVSLGNLPNNTDKQVSFEFSHIDTLVSIDGMANESSNHYKLCDYNNGIDFLVITSSSSNAIIVTTSVNRSSFAGFAILEYTKTTD